MNSKLLTVIIILCGFFFWASSLSFFPTPWPDDSAFFLTGIDWLKWPFHYRMHAQAAFVPSYDVVNFNSMPGLPLLMGIGNFLGIHSSHGIRVYGVLIFVFWALLLMKWMEKKNFKPQWIWLITLAAFFSPVIRWGAMVVRPEIWIGFFWLLILMEFDGFWGRLNLWRLSTFLALGAYVHFEAYFLILPTGIALLSRSLKESLKMISGVFWRTLVLLSPWIVYLFSNFHLFQSQMLTQFSRLQIHNSYVEDAYGVFHSLFLSLGNPVPYPKFFNLGKVLTWAGIVLAIGLGIYRSVKDPDKNKLVLASLLAFGLTFHLWITKPETWFISLIHLSFWPLLILVISSFRNPPPKWVGNLGCFFLGVLVFLEVSVAMMQWKNSRQVYNWEKYRNWVSCIENTIGDRQKIWQPHWPDILVELASHKPDKDYTRSVDFQGIRPLLEKYSREVEVVIHSYAFAPEQPEAQRDYQGPLKKEDAYYLTEYPWMPYKEYSALVLGRPDQIQICHQGPFWAALSILK